MDGDNRQKAFKYLLQIAENQGYITYDNIFDAADKWQLSIDTVDWLSNSIATYGIIVCENAPKKNDDVKDNKESSTDYAQISYDKIYDKVLKLQPSLTNFVNEVRKIRPPQFKEIKGLIYQAKEGNQYACNRIVEMHLRLALKVALQRALLFEEDIEDCLSNACLGLRLAIDSYNPHKNGAFGSYASLWMIQVIAREQGTKRPTVYYPVHRKEQYYIAYPKLKSDGCLECDELLTCSVVRNKIKNWIGCDAEQIEDILKASTPIESLDDIKENNYEFDDQEEYLKTNVLDVIIDTEEIALDHCMRCEKYKILHDLMNKLTDKERKVLEFKFGFLDGKEKTLEEIGHYFGCTRERIRQILEKIYRKFRNPWNSAKFKGYYEFDYKSQYREVKKKKEKNIQYEALLAETRMNLVIPNSIKDRQFCIKDKAEDNRIVDNWNKEYLM